MKRIFCGAAVVFVLLGGAAVHAQGPASRKVSALLREAEVHAGAKDFEKALFKAREALKLAPRDPSCLGLTACYEHATAEYESGLGHALQALKLGGASPWVYAMVGFNAYGSQDFDLARKHLEKAVAAGPDKVVKINYDRATDILKDLKGRTYSIVWTFDPQKAFQKEKDGYICIPCVSTNLPYQTATYAVKGAKGHRVLTGGGNEMLFVLPEGEKTFEVAVRVSVKAFTYKSKLAKVSGAQKFPQEVEVFLGKSWRIDPKDPAVAALGKKLQGKTPLESVKKILAWMKEHIRYEEFQPQTDFRSVGEILERKKTHCVGWSSLLAALCRNVGIPARLVWGTLQQRGDPTGSAAVLTHTWAEVYLPHAGWVPVEPQERYSLGFFRPVYVRYVCFGANGDLMSMDPMFVNIANMDLMSGARARCVEIP